MASPSVDLGSGHMDTLSMWGHGMGRSRVTTVQKRKCSTVAFVSRRPPRVLQGHLTMTRSSREAMLPQLCPLQGPRLYRQSMHGRSSSASWRL